MSFNKKDRVRLEALRHHAEQHGWQLLDPGAPAPSFRDIYASPSSTRLLIVRQGSCGQVWLRWYRWTEVHGLYYIGEREKTRYFVALSGARPDMTVRPRGKLIAFIKARWGQGFRDDFDRMFVIRSKDNTEAAAQVTAAMRRALLEKAVPSWRISGNILITEYDDSLRPENLEERGSAIERVAALLPG